MAWNISTAPAPSFDSGFTTLPGTTTDVPGQTSAVIYPMGMHFCNGNDFPIQVTLTDGAGGKWFDAIDVPAHGSYDPPGGLGFPPFTGMKWFANTASGVTGKIWGYQ